MQILRSRLLVIDSQEHGKRLFDPRQSAGRLRYTRYANDPSANLEENGISPFSARGHGLVRSHETQPAADNGVRRIIGA